MKDKNLASIQKNENKAGLNYSKLKQEDIDIVISNLGPYREITVDECQNMTAAKLSGESASDVLFKIRDESW